MPDPQRGLITSNLNQLFACAEVDQAVVELAYIDGHVQKVIQCGTVRFRARGTVIT